jgi:hypothetical protein
MIKYQASRTRQRLAEQIEEQRSLSKTLMQSRGPLVMGWIHVRYAQCRKGNCKCTHGQPHGPFLYASLRVGRKNVYRYLGKPEDEPLVRKIKSYQEFRTKLAALRKLGRKLDLQWGNLERSLLEHPGR